MDANTFSSTPTVFTRPPTLEIPPFTLEDKPPQVKKANRCCADGCKKKLSLTDFPCKCGKTHCTTHRPSEAHACSFNYKEAHNTFLLKTMSESIQGKKVDVI